MGEAQRAVDRQRWVAGIVILLAIAGVAALKARHHGPPFERSTTPLDLNRATQAELQLLPGIGPAIAARIVAERESRGQFRDVRDLARVSGVGERTVLRLRDFVTVGD